MQDKTFHVKQYDAIYSEVRQCISLQYTILAFGYTAMGVFAKAAVDASLSTDPPPNYSVVAACGCVISALSVLTAFAWSGEVLRMRRAGLYLAAIEDIFLSQDSMPDANVQGSEATSRRREAFLTGFHRWIATGFRRTALRSHYAVVFICTLACGMGGNWVAHFSAKNRPLMQEHWLMFVTWRLTFAAAYIYMTYRFWRINDWNVPASEDEERPIRRV